MLAVGIFKGYVCVVNFIFKFSKVRASCVENVQISFMESKVKNMVMRIIEGSILNIIPKVPAER